MLPGGGLARLTGRRRVHYHGDNVAACSAEHAHHHYGHYRYAHHAAAPVEGPALAAHIRLEEKLRGAALPSSASASTSTSPSRWSRLMRDGRSSPSRHPHRRRDEQEDVVVPATTTGAEPDPAPRRPPPLPDQTALLQQQVAAAAADMACRQRRAELTRTLSKVGVCAVCLDEVRERQRVTRLPCSHKYHTECVLPWLATHPDCPCCRALVPFADTLVQV